MMVIPEARRAHWIEYIRFYRRHLCK